MLYDHFKETFSIIKEKLSQRNKLFVIAFIIMALQFSFALSPESISSLFISIIQEKYKINISGQMVIIQCILWLGLLYFTMQYYQTTVYIERQYNYIHSLEASISDIMHIKFDREGGDYLKNYPKMNDMIDILYKWVFPIIYCLTICFKIIIEIVNSNFGFPIILDLILFFACFVLTILYLVFIHSKVTTKEET